MQDKITICTTLPREFWEVKMKQLAKDTGKNRNELIEEAIENLIKQRGYEIVQRSFLEE